MSTGHPPEQHNDALALQEILGLVEQSVASYNTVANEVRSHQDQIAKERAALRALRTRLVDMRTALNAWEQRVWDMGYRRQVTHESREHAKAKIHTHESALDQLIWQLFDFRDKQR